MIRPAASLEVARRILSDDASETAVQLAASLIRLAVQRDEIAQREDREQERLLKLVPGATQ